MGLLLNRAPIDATFQGFHVLLRERLERADDLYKQLATIVMSSGSTENYSWLGSFPTLKEWVSDRAHAMLDAYTYEIKNKDWSSGIQIDRNEFEDDKLGLIKPRLDLLAQAAVDHYNEILIGLLAGGFTSLAYDGQYFFDTDHKDHDGPTQSNKGTAALSATAFDNAVAVMMRMESDAGTPIGVSPTHLVVPPELRATARGIVEVENLASGASNPNHQAVKLIVSARLTDPTAWFLLDLSKAVKPLVLQIRKPPTPVSQTQDGDEQVYMRRILRFGIDARHAAGYGLYHFAWASDGSVPEEEA